MKNLEFKDIALFPKKTTLLGAILVISLVIFGSFIINKMWSNLVEIDEYHFPMIERSSINVRLVKLIDYQVKLLIKTHNTNIIDDLKLNIESLKQNYASLNKDRLLKDSASSQKVFEQGLELIHIFKMKKWHKAQDFLKETNYLNKLEDFSFEIFDATEEMSLIRDKNSRDIQKVIQKSVLICLLTMLFLLYLLFKIYKAYNANLIERLYAEQKARTLSHQRQTLIHVLCHDLANPISSIFSLIQAKDLLPEEEKKNILDHIENDSQNALNIIEVTRKMQALETGKLTLETNSVNLLESLQSSLSTFQERIKAKNIRVSLKVEADLSVIADEVILINSILNNIISNAIKFSHPDGEIRIYSHKESQDYLLVNIEDDGLGIPDSILSKIFDEDARTSRIGTSGEQGTGFGMPLVKKFMSALGGEIHISSQEGSGTKTQLKFHT